MLGKRLDKRLTFVRRAVALEVALAAADEKGCAGGWGAESVGSAR
jgi:hypothetical protein